MYWDEFLRQANFYAKIYFKKILNEFLMNLLGSNWKRLRSGRALLRTMRENSSAAAKTTMHRIQLSRTYLKFRP